MSENKEPPETGYRFRRIYSVPSSQSTGKQVRPNFQYDDRVKLDFQKTNAQTKAAFINAQKNEQRLVHNYIRNEHLLLGILEMKQEIIVQMLHRIGIDHEVLHRELEQSVQGGDYLQLGEVPVTVNLNRAIAFAEEESEALKQEYIGPEHLFMGIVREGDGLVGAILEQKGITVEKLRAVMI